ncbi:hypothetical protein [Streptomyces hokutonensis]|uniref:hypothetical protein n=1 Tax=Streptomyces hokutonensis TaxID=1306990 RepID=UPI00369736F2
MPDAHSSDSADPFETRLAAGLREAGDAFETDRAALVTAGALKGRRRLLRRRNAAVMSGAAGIAVVGVGTALLLPSGSGTQASPAASASSSAPAPVPRQTLISLLTRLVGDGAYTKVEARGTDEGPAPYVHVVYDDGKGKSAVELDLGRVEPGSDQARQATTCPAKVFTQYDACRTSRLADGSVVMILQGYEYPDRRVDTKLWRAELVTPQGQQVSVREWNAAAEKDSPITRPQPPLSPARLTKLVASKAWRQAIDATPEETPTAAPAPSDTAFGAPVAPTLKSLLPKGLTVSDSSDDDTGFGYLVVDDGKGKSLVQVNVQANMSDVEGDLFGSDAEVLSDGTKVATHQGPGEKGGTGVVMWTVDTIRTDGSRVVISAFNSGAQDTPSTRTAPALTMKQLREIALSPKWR